MDTTSLGSKFRRLRKLQRITQTSIERNTGINRATIYRFEKGSNGIKMGTLLRLLDTINAKLLIIDKES